MHVRQDMHARFDNQDWALVPTLEVLQAIALFDFNRRGKPASSHYTKRFPDKIWDYHFVPLRPSPIVFCRFNDDREFYKVHNYPFETLRLLQSHVHPFFAIYNAAKKIIYHKDKKNNYPDSDSQLPSGFDQHFELCISIFDSWGKPATETQEPRTITQPPPSNSSHPPGTSRSQPSQGSQQSQDRAERARRRNNKSDVQDPPQSGPGAAPQGRKRMVATSTGDQYLPTPEQPLYITNGCDHQLAAMDSETSSGTRHWTSVSDWIEGVKVSGPCEDPYEGYTENEKQSLIQYSSEEARCPPWGPWEEWIPEYKIV
ncbi:hypothetical protein FRC11_009647 [Ceratobasidium sp. 423]|nr:hypothetical protein FRC11_009647 [Ceratobasidium sp. 423]